MKNLIYDIFRIVKKSEILFLAFIKIFRKKEYECIVQKDYDLCICGYPSSANTFVYKYINELYKGTKKISHHNHSPGVMKRAIKCNVPAVFISRNPVDAISSYYVRFSQGNTFSIKTALKAYVDFYNVVKQYCDKIIIIDMKTITNDMPYWLNIIFEKINIEYSKERLDNESDVIVQAAIRNIQEFESSRPTTMTSLPSKEKETLKQKVINELNSIKGYETAVELYDYIHQYSIENEQNNE